MNEFTNEINLRACLTSGQVFRFQKVDEAWVGVDGTQILTFREPMPEPTDPGARSFFRLDWDYCKVIPELISRGRELEPMANASRGLRLLRPSCPRETLFAFLCTSNNHISRISKMVAKLSAFGATLQGSNHRWPELDRIAALSESELRSLGFGYRAKTIPKVAQCVLDRGGAQWFEWAQNAPYDELIGDLITLPGVGPKLADCIALYAFDKTEAVPIDTHFWQAATRIYFPKWREETLTPSHRQHTGKFMRDRFGELAGLAQQLLFYANLRDLWKIVPETTWNS